MDGATDERGRTTFCARLLRTNGTRENTRAWHARHVDGMHVVTVTVHSEKNKRESDSSLKHESDSALKRESDFGPTIADNSNCGKSREVL